MIYVIGDLHFGVRKNSKTFHRILRAELKTIEGKVTKEDTVVILGDIFDSRSSTDFEILNDATNFFISLSNKSKEVFILVGNHDLYYKENRKEFVNCAFLEYKPSENSDKAPVHVISSTQEIEIENKKCLFIPWIDNAEKFNEVKSFLTKQYDFIFGHFDVIGLYNNTDEKETDFRVEDFPKEAQVLSGHYHIRSKDKNLLYVGSLINTTFNDVGEVKGYHTIDQKGKIKFYKGKSPQFEYVNIDNPKDFLSLLKEADEKSLKKIQKKISGNIIQIIFNRYACENEEIYRMIKGMTTLELTVAYNRMSIDSGDDGEDFEGFDTTSDINIIISDYIDNIKDQIPENVCTKDLKDFINQKFQEYKSNTEVI